MLLTYQYIQNNPRVLQYFLADHFSFRPTQEKTNVDKYIRSMDFHAEVAALLLCEEISLLFLPTDPFMFQINHVLLSFCYQLFIYHANL